MATTVKRITVNLTKEDERQLKALCLYLGENQTQVIQRVLNHFYMWRGLDQVAPLPAPASSSSDSTSEAGQAGSAK